MISTHVDPFVTLLILLSASLTVQSSQNPQQPQQSRRLHLFDDYQSSTSWQNWWRQSYADDNVVDRLRLTPLTFSVEEIDYVRRVLTFAFDMRRTPIGSILQSDGDDVRLQPAVLTDMVDRFRSLDINVLADRVVADHEQQLTEAMTTLERLVAEQRTAEAYLVDWPWLPAANQSDCTKDYSQFIDPITNRVWKAIRDQLCQVAPVLCSMVPPVNTTMPDWGRGSKY